MPDVASRPRVVFVEVGPYPIASVAPSRLVITWAGQLLNEKGYSVTSVWDDCDPMLHPEVLGRRPDLLVFWDTPADHTNRTHPLNVPLGGGPAIPCLYLNQEDFSRTAEETLSEEALTTQLMMQVRLALHT